MIQNEDFYFDEQDKAIMPKSTTCSCCGAEADKSSMFFIKVYAESDRTNMIFYSSVSYKELKIGVARCKSCENIHNNAKNIERNIYIFFGVVLIILFFVLGVYSSFFKFLLFIVIVLLGVIFIGVKSSDYYAQSKGIRSQIVTQFKNPVVVHFLDNGWSMHKPTP